MAVGTSAALSLSLLAAPAVAETGEPGSAWGKDAPRFTVPEVKPGSNEPVASRVEAPVEAEVAAWRAEQKKRAAGQSGGVSARGRAADAAPSTYVPEGQGRVPWHKVSDFAITDALSAHIDFSTGNLMLTATDFDVAGVGQSLRLARTYNSLDAPWGKISQRWWQQYERYLQLADDEAVLYDASGNTLRFGKKPDGTFTSPKGYSKELKKNADGTWTVTDWKSSSKDTYDTNGTLTKVTDRNKGTITVTQHDEGGEHKGFKLTETRSGRWVDLVRTDASQWQAKDHTGRTAVFDLDATGNLARTTDAEGKTTAFGYDSSRRLTKITTAEGRVTAFTYDGVNRVTSMLRATELNGSGHTGPTWTYAYGSASPTESGTTKATDPEDHATTYAHDSDGQVDKVTDHLGRDRSTKFDANHNVDTATDAMGTGGVGGNVTDYGFNARNNLEEVKQPTGGKSVNSWQTIAGGDVPKDSTNADGEKTTFGYDTVGNTTSVAQTGSGGGSVSYTYNSASPTCGGFEGQRCTQKTKLSSSKTVTTSFHHDAKGNLDKVTPPAPLAATTYTYDALGRTETTTDGRGTKTVYTYDNLDRIRKVSSTNDTVTYAYDGDGNLTQRTDSTGVVKYAFDPLQRETVRTLQDGSQTLLAYTPAGNVDFYQDPAGKTDYTYNAVNKLTELKDPQGRLTTYGYNGNDVRTRTTYPGGTVQNTDVDESSRPKRIWATSSKGTVTDLSYTYGYGTGGKTDGSKIRTRTDAVAGTKTSYSYDGAGRFSYAAENKGSTLNESWQYCYDLAGNLTSQGIEQGCPRGTTYSLNDAQQITAKNGSTTNWSYDKDGNETAAAPTPEGTRTAETWSDHSQLTSLTVGGKTYQGQYGSTDQSERIRLGDTYFHNGPLGLSATSTAGADTGFNREAGGTLNSVTTGGKAYFYLTDALGSVIALTDESGSKVNAYSYSPRGVTRASSTEKIAQPYRFTAGYQDPTGLYHLQARYYDPALGRFTQPDPSGQEQNPYLYAEGDPVNRIDPDGLFSFSDILDTGSDIFGVVSGCVAGISAAAETGSIAYAGAVGGAVGAGVGSAVGAGAAVVGSCALGGTAGYYGAEILTYG
ncbi:RHS repeat-associated core domain-containing protein [Streptomyces physcomitrii]|uniref:RHS repeat-associated core domain-containing protein n=1 Tax=Streptomyces physcomitrii TaxID=2724184 RepID=A0ABX1H0K5_9ACTN|nr:RHS repeat-associated core domain-containing protein [Streptomyces physcomitrii]